LVEQKSVLAVFAHPDDEAFGVGGALKMYADRGDKTALVCATRGEQGEISDPALATPETLGAVREAELRESCRILGIGDLSFLDYRDGRLAQANRAEAVGRLVRQIRRLRPQVLVTFDANGGYGHLDHIAIHEITGQAFAAAGDPTVYPEQIGEGLEAYVPRKLYYVAAPRGTMARISEQLVAMGMDFRPGGDAATIPHEQMGTPDEEITTVIPLDDEAYHAKRAAWAAHRTQNPADGPLARLPEVAQRDLWGTERFVRAAPPAVPGQPIEDDLFAGISL